VQRPLLAAWSLAAGVVATTGANLAHGLTGALVSAWPALALVGPFELLMLLIRTKRQSGSGGSSDLMQDHPVPVSERDEPPTEPPARSWSVHAPNALNPSR
jgi:hypothetical protein